jgi:Pectate lyase superfamily protein
LPVYYVIAGSVPLQVIQSSSGDLYSVKDFGGAIGNGSSDDYAAILAAVNEAASSGESSNVVFPPGTYLVGSNLSIPSSVTAIFHAGATLRPANGVTITMTPNLIVSEVQQIFDPFTLGGTIAWQTVSPSMQYAAIGKVSACWWGADPTGTKDSAPAINASILAASTLPFTAQGPGADPRIGYKVRLPTGTYLQNGPIYFPRRTILEGDGGYNEATTIITRPAGVIGAIVNFEEYGLLVGIGSTTFSNGSGTVIRDIKFIQSAHANYAKWQINTIYPANSTVQANIGSHWSANALITSGTFIQPVAYNGGYYVCTTPGTTGSVEPQWTAPSAFSPGSSTVNDNGVIWTLVGYIPECMYFTTAAGGTSGATQPSWPRAATDSANLATVTDNTIVWVTHEKGVAVRLYANAHLERVGINSSEDAGINMNGNAGGSPVTSVDDWHMEGCIVQNCVGHGVIAQGADGSVGVAFNCHFSSNTGWGVIDNGFLANNWISIDCESNYGPYAIISQDAQSVLLGCYSEGDQKPSVVYNPNITIGGDHAAGFTVYSKGIIGGGNQGLVMSPTQFTTNHQTTGGSGYNVTIGESGQPTVLFFQSLADRDPNFLRFIYDTVKKQITWTGNNSTGYSGYSLTSYANREGVAMPLFPRGLSVGPYGQNGFDGIQNDSGPRIDSGVSAPSIGSDITWFRVGDITLNTDPLKNGIAYWICVSRGAFCNTAWAPSTNYSGGSFVVNGNFTYRSVGNGVSSSGVGPNFSGTTTTGGTLADGSGATAFTWECFGSNAPTFHSERVIGGLLTHDMSSDANYTLASTELLLSIIAITDVTPNLTTGRSIILPLFSGAQKAFSNQTLQTLTFIGATGTGFTLATGKRCTGYTDGTNWYQLTAAD